MSPFLAFALLVLLITIALGYCSQANWFLTSCLLLLSVVMAARAAADAGLLVVYTPSVPVGVYWRHIVQPHGLTVGQYVCVEAISPAAPPVLRGGVLEGWLPSAWRTEPLVKRVAGVAGDRVSYEGASGVRVNAELVPLSVAREADSSGHALPKPAYPLELGANEVWLRSEHSEGFDSRYFGPVNVAALTCIAEPVWTL